MFQLFNDWFDLLNTQQKIDNNSASYGLSIEIQDKLLDRMTDFVTNMRVHEKKCLLPFQKGRFYNIY